MSVRVGRWARGLALSVLLVAAGCGDGGVTSSRLDVAVATTFGRLYVVQQRDHGRTVTPDQLGTRAQCSRPTLGGSPQDASRGGPADDWTCLVSWQLGEGRMSQAQYGVTVRTNGCYSADGEGPTEINGLQQVVTPDGQPVANPLWRFDGCFDVS